MDPDDLPHHLVFAQHFEVVTDHHHRQMPLPVQPLDQVHNDLRRSEVNTAQRLVQQQDVWLGRQSPRDQHPLTLATGQRRERFPLKVAQSNVVEAAVDPLPLRVGDGPAGSHAPIGSHQRHLKGRQRKDHFDGLPLRDVPEADRSAIQHRPDASAKRLQDAGHALQDRALAASVGPHKGDKIARIGYSYGYFLRYGVEWFRISLLSRNQVYGNVSWVRIPPSSAIKSRICAGRTTERWMSGLSRTPGKRV